MGETSDDEQDVDAARGALAAHAEGDDRLAPIAAALRAGGGPVPPSRDVPTILDTDIGGDPDDAVALLAAVRHVPNLALVSTCDEHAGDRARFARHLLDLLDRPDVPVVTGTALGGTTRDGRTPDGTPYFCVGDLIPPAVPAQPGGLLAAVTAIADATTGPVRWIGLGPMTNLATVLSARPDLADRLTVTQMGGAISYRDPTRAEHNFRLDPAAVHTALRLARTVRLVTSDVTFTPRLEITAATPAYQALTAGGAPAWARLLAAHMDAWFAAAYPGTIQHDPLTVAAAVQLPFVDFALDRIGLDTAARMTRHPEGIRVSRSVAADYDAVWTWLTTGVLDTAPDRADPA